jgi:signal transduction histidine kinase
MTTDRGFRRKSRSVFSHHFIGWRRRAIRTKAGGGLGLSVARTVAREHGGDVTLMNRDGGGLSVLIELPAE